MILVVQEYGAQVGKKSNCIYVKSAKGEKEVSSDKMQELHLHSSCSVSADAIQLCMKKDIWILFFDEYGNPAGEIVPFSGGSSPLYKRKQLFLADHAIGVEIIKGLLIQKIQNRMNQLERILSETIDMDTILYLSIRMKRMEDSIQKIQDMMASCMNEVRDSLQGLEGSAGRAYFECISYLLPDDMKFAQRRRDADDIYNASLNYLYGIMYAKIKQMMYRCRLDPYIGIMHVDTYNKPTFVFDFIEGQRIHCEEIAFQLCSDRIISSDDLVLEGEKRWLTKEVRSKLISSYYARMNEKTVYENKKITNERRLQMELIELAQKIGEWKFEILAAV